MVAFRNSDHFSNDATIHDYIVVTVNPVMSCSFRSIDVVNDWTVRHLPALMLATSVSYKTYSQKKTLN